MPLRGGGGGGVKAYALVSVRGGGVRMSAVFAVIKITYIRLLCVYAVFLVFIVRLLLRRTLLYNALRHPVCHVRACVWVYNCLLANFDLSIITRGVILIHR